jgi:hypothetical protein
MSKNKKVYQMVSMISKQGLLISKFNSTSKITPLAVHKRQVYKRQKGRSSDIENREVHIKIQFRIRN